MRRAYRGKILTPVAAGPVRYLEDGLLVVGDDGTIDAVEPFTEGRSAGPVLDVRPSILMPGFVDAHVHFPQARIVGSASGPLLRWLETTVFPEEARFREEAYARAVAREFVARLLSVGTTTSAVFSSSSARATEIAFEELARSGLRAIIGLTLMDERCPRELCVPAAEALSACRALIDEWHGFDRGRIGFAITPRFALSCSRALMEGASRLARDHDLVVQTHVAENPAEGVETLRAHPFAEHYLGVYDATGLLGPRTVLAHAIHLSAREWDLCAERGARIAHCPDSNFFLGSGRMRLGEARSRDVRVGLGSDVAAGRSFDMRRAMASAYDNALCLEQTVTPAELLRMATLGGAEALGLERVTGSLEAGKDADFIVLGAPRFVRGEEQVLGHVAFSADGGRVERVFVRGRMLERRASQFA